MSVKKDDGYYDCNEMSDKVWRNLGQELELTSLSLTCRLFTVSNAVFGSEIQLLGNNKPETSFQTMKVITTILNIFEQL